MEIKRRLNKVAKRLTPAIESMNVGLQMKELCSRLEELVTYAEQKIQSAANRKEALGVQIAREKEEQQKVIEDHQREEVEANQKDQEEAFNERNGIEPDSEEEVISDELAEETLAASEKDKADAG